MPDQSHQNTSSLDLLQLRAGGPAQLRAHAVLSEAGSISLKEGTVYPILGRLDCDGLVRSEWVESAQGPPWKYYALTAAGRQLFDELRQEFELLVSLAHRKWKASGQSDWGGKKIFVRKG